MRTYIRSYGWHFTKRACNYAVSLMRNGGQRIEPIFDETLRELLKKNSITLDNDVMADALYVANMCKADYYKRSVPDEAHLALFVRDTVDDEDAADGTIMRRWYASMVAAGTPVDWEEIMDTEEED